MDGRKEKIVEQREGKVKCLEEVSYSMHTVRS